jgi:RNA polymerase sigma-70 factor (ECF subfamily)
VTVDAAGPVPDRAADEVFAAERRRLVGLAYRMLGSVLDAEDIVQEAWIRWDRADQGVIERPAAWLTTVVSHLALDRLRARQREREDYVGPWLPEPLVEPSGPAAAAPVSPEQHAELADSLSTAFLVLLESLSPTERLVVLLVDVFGETFAAVAGIVGRSDDATRQLAVRARRKLRRDGAAPLEGRRPDAGQQRLAEAFAAALLAGDQATLVRLVAPDVVMTSDGGAEVRAARRPVVGRYRVLRLLDNLIRRFPPELIFDWVRVNGSPGLVVRLAGSAVMVVQIEVHGGVITAVRAVLNPHKLQAVEHPVRLR